MALGGPVVWFLYSGVSNTHQGQAKAAVSIHRKEEGLEEETKKKEVATLLTKTNDVCTLDGQSGEGGVPCSKVGRRTLFKAIHLLDLVSNQREKRYTDDG
ncbi:hypothetical protein VNO80_25199 [Phaseolus coccineus]|uniref:Uncharacterized protein n=1 Tax=Phaseolus coccineus TaxID=3886 RepID=A0AAN9LUB4_PHACN